MYEIGSFVTTYRTISRILLRLWDGVLTTYLMQAAQVQA